MDNALNQKGKCDISGQTDLTNKYLSTLGIKTTKQEHKPHKVFLNTLRYFIIANTGLLFQASWRLKNMKNNMPVNKTIHFLREPQSDLSIQE
mgnify:CR=1 FL=1